MAVSKKKKKKKANPKSRYTGIAALLIVLILAVFIVANPAKRMNKKQSDQTEIAQRTPNPEFTEEGSLIFYNKTGEKNVEIAIEISDDDYEREVGLMHRRQMKEKQGMLFIFPEMEMQSFWMRNTYLPLDILYVDDQLKIVDIHENTSPMSDESIPSSAPAKYVIEVNAGFCTQYYIEPGDSVSFKRK